MEITLRVCHLGGKLAGCQRAFAYRFYEIGRFREHMRWFGMWVQDPHRQVEFLPDDTYGFNQIRIIGNQDGYLVKPVVSIVY